MREKNLVNIFFIWKLISYVKSYYQLILKDVKDTKNVNKKYSGRYAGGRTDQVGLRFFLT